MGTVVTCVVFALTSTFSPVIGGPDSPAVAVMSAGGLDRHGARRQGRSDREIVINVPAASVSTLLTGILLYGVGALKMGQWLRFIPYPVIGGLAASGILLITGGMEVVTRTNLTLSPSSWQVLYSSLYAPQILIGALFAVSIPVLGRFVPNYLALPIAFFGFLVLDVSLFGFFNDATIHSAWFLPSLGEWPVVADQCHDRPAGRLGRDRPEQRRDRLILRRDGDCVPPTCRASRWRGRRPAISIRSFAPTVLPISWHRCSAALADRCR